MPPEEPSRSNDPETHDVEIAWPSHINFVATVESGKTTAARYIARKYKHEFDDILVISSNKQEEEWADVVEDAEQHVFEQGSEGMLTSLMEHARETNSRILLVVDDPIGLETNRGWNPKYSPALAKIATSGRHQGNGGISLMYISQRVTKIPNVLRDNAKYNFIGNISENQVNLACEDWADPVIGKQGMRRLLQRVCSDKNRYRFLVTDARRRSNRLWSVPDSESGYVGSNTAQDAEIRAQ